MNQQEIISAIALTRISFFSLAELLELFRRVGSAEEIVAHSQHIRDLLPDASDRLTQAFTDIGEALRYAESELRTAESMGVRPLVMGDDDYPSRLLECADAPLVLYYQGSASLGISLRFSSSMTSCFRNGNSKITSSNFFSSSAEWRMVRSKMGFSSS